MAHVSRSISTSILNLTYLFAAEKMSPPYPKKIFSMMTDNIYEVLRVQHTEGVSSPLVLRITFHCALSLSDTSFSSPDMHPYRLGGCVSKSLNAPSTRPRAVSQQQYSMTTRVGVPLVSRV